MEEDGRRNVEPAPPKQAKAKEQREQCFVVFCFDLEVFYAGLPVLQCASVLMCVVCVCAAVCVFNLHPNSLSLFMCDCRACPLQTSIFLLSLLFVPSFGCLLNSCSSSSQFSFDARELLVLAIDFFLGRHTVTDRILVFSKYRTISFCFYLKILITKQIEKYRKFIYFFIFSNSLPRLLISLLFTLKRV